MRTLPAFFGFVTSACASARAVPPAEPAASVARPAPKAPAAIVTACRATPSTVYGTEPVTFSIEAADDAHPHAAPFELTDEHGRLVARGALDVPGVWQAGELASGDYSLKLGTSPVTCAVTVNREVSRGQAATPK